MNRAARRRLEKLAVENEPVTTSDAKFFERFPHRKHRIRPASAAEIATMAELSSTGRVEPLPSILRWFTAVRQVAPGVRMRVFLIGTADADIDPGEEIAAVVFEETSRGTGAVIPADGRPL